MVHFFGFEKDQEEAIQNGMLSSGAINQLGNIEVYFNFDSQQALNPNIENVLVIYEPECVMPWQYSIECREMFNLVICLNPWRAKKHGIKNWDYQPIETMSYTSSRVSGKRTSDFVMVNSHKFSASHESGYSLRRKVIRLMEREGLDFSLYGHNWNMGKVMELRKRVAAVREVSRVSFKEIDWNEALSDFWVSYESYKGSIGNKLEILSSSKLAIIIENDFNTLSEKVFDAIFALTIPIYVGPDVSSIRGLQECLFVAKPNASQIIELTKHITRKALEDRRIAIEKFISDETNMYFCNPRRVWENVGRMIAENLTVSRKELS